MPGGGGGGGGAPGARGGAVAVLCAPSGISVPSIVVGGPTITPTTRRSRLDRAGASGATLTAAGAAATATFSPVHSRNSPHEPQNVSVSRLD
jgi:hypothetical protein